MSDRRKVSKTRLDECVDIESPGERYLDLKALMYELGVEIIPRTLDEAKNLIRQNFVQVVNSTPSQQEPEIDDMEKYVEEKVEWFMLQCRGINSLLAYEDIQKDIKTLIAQIISDARGLQVPVVKIKKSRIKLERMDYMEKGAKFGKSKSGAEDEKFPYKCCEKCDRLIKQFACKGVHNAIECLYLLSKKKIKKKGGK